MKDYIQLRKFPVKDMLKLLLTDKTTGKNITFATNSYADYGINFAEDSYITETEILGIAECEIQPRICARLLNSRLSERKIKPKFSHPLGYATE